MQIATIQVDQLQAANDALKAAGKPEINVLTFDQNPLAVEQLRTGRADAVIADSPVVANDARLSEGKLEALGLTIEAAPYGIGVRKDSTELKAAIEEALQKLIANGKYEEILIEVGSRGRRHQTRPDSTPFSIPSALHANGEAPWRSVARHGGFC